MQFTKENVGEKLRHRCKLKRLQNKSWVPIGQEKRSIHSWPGRHLEVIRTQFPFIPAEAITIHKSQGSTFKDVVVSTQFTTSNGRTRSIPRRALYVAFSRPRALGGLFIDGMFEPPEPPLLGDPSNGEVKTKAGVVY